MKATLLLRPLAASTLLLAAACGGSGPADDAGNGMAVNEALANLDEALPDDNDLAADDVELASLPPLPADAPAAETAPLAQAAQIAREIDTDTAVERVPFEGGWAWRRGGRIIRTASRDGRRVAWFRPGEGTPFLVQQGDETLAYRGGRVQRAFDRRGRPGAVTAQRREEARRLAEQSRSDRDRAERARRRPGNDRNGANRDDDRTGPGRDGDRPGANRHDENGNGTSADRNERRGARDRNSRTGEWRPRTGRDDQGNHQ